jgi:4,5-DOPA dioxygenase extradiol
MHDNRLPAIFFGHGSPMNAIEENRFTETWSAIGSELPRPRGIVAVSAHWYTNGSGVTAMQHPPTIHDFGNFPQELHRYEYPAPGDPQLATRVRSLLAPSDVALDRSWGLDHGTWSVLCHVYPKANIPIVELSIDALLSPAGHYELARRLAPLRDEGVLVMGSGNVVHNLEQMRWGSDAPPAPWASEYESKVRRAILDGDTQALINYDKLTPDAALAAPDIEHYLPLLYVLAVRHDGEQPVFPTAGIVASSISMLSVRFG